jgi:outer membrane cobalamin receptor
MKHNYSILVAGAAWGALVVSSFAQNPSSEQPTPAPSLEPVVVQATKIPQELEGVGSAVTVLSREDLDRSQTRRLEDAFRFVPGAVLVPSGQTGAISSPILRGANPNQTQIVVDGIRISDANISPDIFLGGEQIGLLQTIEVLRGPQGALYGGEAIGGVIHIVAPRGSGAPVSTFDVLAGSFGTFGAQLTSAGEIQSLSYSLSTGWNTTANDRPHNDFANLFQAVRIDLPLSESTTVGFTYRGADRSYQSPGTIFDNDTDNIEEEEFLLLTAYIDHQFSERWNSKLVTGRLQQDLGFIAPPWPESIVDHRKLAFDWRNTFTWNDSLTTLIGTGYETRDMTNTGYGSVTASDSLVSLYADQVLSLGERLSLTGGGRWESYRTIGEALTWRGTAAYHIEESGTTFRSSVGTGFRAPSFFELYARDAFFTGNPGLTPEESLGWDAGIAQEIGDAGTLSLTWFDNDISDLIVTDFAAAPLSVINLESATTTGVEAEFAGSWQDRVHYRLAYTYLQAEDADTGETLLRRPKHTLGFDVNTLIADRLTVGVGGQLIEDRLDIDPVSFLPVTGDSYFLGRAYGALQITEDIQAHLSVENVLDEEYEVIAGFPGRGLGVFGGVKISF